MENKKGFVRIGDDILEVDAEKLKNEIIDVSRCIKVAEVKKEPCEHKWIIDEFNQDVCKKCRINKQFYEGIRLGRKEVLDEIEKFKITLGHISKTDMAEISTAISLEDFIILFKMKEDDWNRIRKGVEKK